MTQLVTLHFGPTPTSVLCHFGDFGCGDGTWTTVMKIDGHKVLAAIIMVLKNHDQILLMSSMINIQLFFLAR